MWVRLMLSGLEFATMLMVVSEAYTNLVRALNQDRKPLGAAFLTLEGGETNA